MNVTQQMIDAMIELKSRLADALDDDYSDIIDEVLGQYGMSDEENDYCQDNYLDA